MPLMESLCRSWTEFQVELVEGGKRRLVHTHQTREALECARNAHSWIDFDEDTLRRVDVHLKKASLVQGRVEKSQEALL